MADVCSRKTQDEQTDRRRLKHVPCPLTMGRWHNVQ